MQTAFASVVLDPSILDRLGPALNSGKALFVYGPAGTGKTYITQRLVRLLDDAVLVPHAIAVGDIHRHGLFAEHVLAVFGCFDGVEAMHEHRSGEIDGVDLRIGKDFSRVRTSLGDAMPLLKLPEPCRLLSGASQQS
jgi:hypothetical protein